jgi:hypothetical protein
MKCHLEAKTTVSKAATLPALICLGIEGMAWSDGQSGCSLEEK